jgi:tetratricopeptide (TPR) repeat protein
LPRAPRIGSISPGASADLLLLTSDPSAAVESLRTREAVVVRGRLLERAELEALAAAQTRRNVEAKELADHVDALLESRRLTEAGPLFTQLERAERPGVAEWVLWAKHKKLGPEARAAAIIIAELATRLYPQSFSAEYELANLLFAAGQATESRRHVALSLELAPSNAASQNLSEKLRLSERPPEFDPRGIYVLRPDNVVQPGGGEFRVEITDDSPLAGRITGPKLSDAPLTEVFAAADRLWLSAQSAFGPVELRLTVESGSVRGYFASPFGRNGTLEGTKNR